MSWIEGTQNRPPPRFRSNGELAKMEGFLDDGPFILINSDIITNNKGENINNDDDEDEDEDTNNEEEIMDERNSISIWKKLED